MYHGFVSRFSQNILAAQMFTALIIIKTYVSWVANQHIRRISEGSCDTEG